MNLYLWKNSLVKVEKNRILLGHDPIKYTLHVAMCSQRLSDVTTEPLLGPQLYGFEPRDVLAVKEHEAHSGMSLVYLYQI